LSTVAATLDAPEASRHGGGSPARGARRRRALVGWAFLVPLLAVNLLVVLGPSLATLYYSMTDWTGLGSATFIGLGNYGRALHDPDVWNALWHNVIWLVLFLIVPTLLGLLGAYLLTRVRRGQMVFRTLYFIPYITASVINAAVWKMLLSPTSGVAYQLGQLGIPGIGDISFLGDPNLALYTVNFVVNWHFWGFTAVIYFAAMQSVDRDLYDAAEVDGANRWQQFRSVTLPGIRPTLIFMWLMSIIWTLKAFDYIYIMTDGGPGGASEVMATLMYRKAFNEYDAGYAASLGIWMTILTALVLVGYQVVRRKGWES
jgi:raffinose/stachyose/melibiose transport system permease protein